MRFATGDLVRAKDIVAKVRAEFKQGQAKLYSFGRARRCEAPRKVLVLEECLDAADLAKAGFERLQGPPLQLIGELRKWPANELLTLAVTSPIRLPAKWSRAFCCDIAVPNSVACRLSAVAADPPIVRYAG